MKKKSLLLILKLKEPSEIIFWPTVLKQTYPVYNDIKHMNNKYRWLDTMISSLLTFPVPQLCVLADIKYWTMHLKKYKNTTLYTRMWRKAHSDHCKASVVTDPVNQAVLVPVSVPVLMLVLKQTLEHPKPWEVKPWILSHFGKSKDYNNNMSFRDVLKPWLEPWFVFCCYSELISKCQKWIFQHVILVLSYWHCKMLFK